MGQLIKDGDLSNFHVDDSEGFSMGVKVIENFTLWLETNKDEVHMIMSGCPVINVDNQFKTLHEGDILTFHAHEQYRYFSKGSSLIFTFKGK